MHRSNTKKSIFLVGLIATFSFAFSAQAISFTNQEKAKLKAGKTIRKPLQNSQKKGFYGGSGFVLIDAPVDVVWKAIMNFENYSNLFPATQSVTEVARKGDTSLIHFRMGYKMINLQYFASITQDKSKNTIRFKMVENRPHDITSASGYWKLFPQAGNKTLIAYVVSAKLPMGVVNLMKPHWHAAIEKDLISAPKNIKKHVESPAGKKYYTQTAKK